MAEILAVTTHGTDDPTKCTLAFATAVGGLGAGKEVSIALLGEAVYLVKKGVADTIHGVGFPPLPELIEKVVKGKVPFYVWGSCSVARGVTKEDLKPFNAAFIDAVQFASLISEASVVTFQVVSEVHSRGFFFQWCRWGAPIDYTTPNNTNTAPNQSSNSFWDEMNDYMGGRMMGGSGSGWGGMMGVGMMGGGSGYGGMMGW